MPLVTFRTSSDQNIVTIKIFAARKTALRIQRTATMSVIDMISNVGGTIGLFLGFSILSVVEVLFWAAAGVMRHVDRCTRMF